MLAALVVLVAATAWGEEVKPVAALSGLNRPVDLAVRPGASTPNYEIYVAEAGAGRVVRVGGESTEARPVITGFPTGDDDGVGGLRAMAFLNRDALAVTWIGSRDDGSTTAVYALTDDGAPLEADEHRQVADARRVDAAGVVTALAGDARYVYASQHGPSGVSVLRVRNNAGVLGEFRRLLAIDSPHAAPLVVTPDGYLLAASREELDGGRRVLEFYDPYTERAPPRLRHSLNLEDVRDLAYGALPRPASRLLYAINGGDAPAERQGVHRLDAVLDEQGRQACRATLVVTVAEPTALAFGPDGAMFVTTSDGQLLRFNGEF